MRDVRLGLKTIYQSLCVLVRGRFWAMLSDVGAVEGEGLYLLGEVDWMCAWEGGYRQLVFVIEEMLNEKSFELPESVK